MQKDNVNDPNHQPTVGALAPTCGLRKPLSSVNIMKKENEDVLNELDALIVVEFDGRDSCLINAITSPRIIDVLESVVREYGLDPNGSYLIKSGNKILRLNDQTIFFKGSSLQLVNGYC